jgi:hypothetical protein
MVTAGLDQVSRSSPMGSIFEAFKSVKRLVTGEVIQRIDTTADGGGTTMSLRLKRGRGSDDLYTVMMVGGGGNYRYIVFTNDELIQFSKTVETILNSLTHGRQPTT